LVKRDQHSGFGKELRALLTSDKSEDLEIAGIIVDEIDALDEARANGRAHPKEDRLNGPKLSAVQYLRIYSNKQSIRIYFTVVKQTLFMLALDKGKRQTALTAGMEHRLLERLTSVQQQHGGT